jgi:N-acetyl-anhydromuramyl-L-alanine amidase AmpD
MLAGFQQLVFAHSLGFPYDRPVRGVIWHTTQGTTVQGAVSVYQSIQACPHLTVDPETFERFQHVPLDSAAYALRNLDGGCETNSTGVIQIEIVGYAADAWSWSPQRLQWLGEEVLAPILAEYPDIPHTVYTGDRMTCAEWDVWAGGMAGHKDVPENDHTDPGDLDLQRILDYATGDDMPTAKEIAEALMDELVPVHDYDSGKNTDVPLRVALGYIHGELSLLRHHTTGEPIH